MQPAKHFIVTLSVALPVRKNSLKDASVSTEAPLIKTLLLGNSAGLITSRHMIFCELGFLRGFELFGLKSDNPLSRRRQIKDKFSWGDSSPFGGQKARHPPLPPGSRKTHQDAPTRLFYMKRQAQFRPKSKDKTLCEIKIKMCFVGHRAYSNLRGIYYCPFSARIAARIFDSMLSKC